MVQVKGLGKSRVEGRKKKPFSSAHSEFKAKVPMTKDRPCKTKENHANLIISFVGHKHLHEEMTHTVKSAYICYVWRVGSCKEV